MTDPTGTNRPDPSDATNSGGATVIAWPGTTGARSANRAVFDRMPGTDSVPWRSGFTRGYQHQLGHGGGGGEDRGGVDESAFRAGQRRGEALRIAHLAAFEQALANGVNELAIRHPDWDRARWYAAFEDGYVGEPPARPLDAAPVLASIEPCPAYTDGYRAGQALRAVHQAEVDVWFDR